VRIRLRMIKKSMVNYFTLFDNNMIRINMNDIIACIENSLCDYIEFSLMKNFETVKILFLY
jgi:hypothetical protein